MAKDYYEVLGVQRSANQDEIKKAFRRVSKKYHPDINPEPDAQEKFQEANEAYQVLSDPDKRKRYDTFGHAAFGQGDFGAGGFAGGDFSDIFDEFMGAFTGRQRSSGRRRSRQGRDLRADLNLTFEQAVFGDTVDIEVTRLETCEVCDGSGAEAGTSPTTCPDCNGAGQVRQMRQTFLGSMVTVTDCPRCGGAGTIIEKRCNNCDGSGRRQKTRTLEVNVPPGVDDGTQIRLSGEGEPGERGGPAGHLYVVLHVQEHEYFKRRNHDILLEININIAQAALGDKIVVPTVEGEETIDIKAGTQTGHVVRLKNLGFPKLRSNGTTQGRGDQVCLVNVAVPTKLTKEQRQLFEELSKTLGTELVTTGQDKNIFDRVVDFFSGS